MQILIFKEFGSQCYINKKPCIAGLSYIIPFTGSAVLSSFAGRYYHPS